MNGGPWKLEEHMTYYPGNFNDGLAKGVLEVYKPNTILEFGCGVGYYCNHWANNNVEIVHGIEPNTMNTKMFDHPNCRQIEFDITKDTNHNDILAKYDVVISIEVAEHIQREYHDKLFDFLVEKSKDIIIFSGARIGQPGHGHVSCRDEEDWRSEFLKRGKVYDEEMTKIFRTEKSNKKNPNHCRNIQIFRN